MSGTAFRADDPVTSHLLLIFLEGYPCLEKPPFSLSNDSAWGITSLNGAIGFFVSRVDHTSALSFQVRPNTLPPVFF
jgi:hypothetical protein